MAGKRVGIVGGGLGGLSAAVRLAKMGFEVSLFEKNSRLGGKMNEKHINGFRFDTGPSLLTMPFVIDELYDFLKQERKMSLIFQEIDPICKYFYQDGTIFNARKDYNSLMDEFDTIFPDEKSSYHRFIEYTRKIFDTSAGVFLFTPMHEVKKLINFRTLILLLKSYRIDPLRTVNTALHQFFKDPRLIQLFNRYATYNGSNPFWAPATLNIIPYVEIVLGGYYIKGGMYKLVSELEKIAREISVSIHTDTRVERIEYSNSSITGLSVNNEFVPFDYIVCNADVVESYNKLITGKSKTTKKLQKLEPSLSGLVFLWSVKGEYSAMAHHNIFFSNNYQNEFAQIFEQLEVPEDPTVYISITKKSDTDHAPPGHENWFVLVNMPYLTGKENWNKIIDRIRKKVIDKLRSHGIEIENNIILENVLTPEDFCQIYESNRGSIYGLSSNSRATAFTRPANRSRTLQGLFFAGGSVHPGGGVPLVILSGKMTADLIGEQEGIKGKTKLSQYLQKHVSENSYFN